MYAYINYKGMYVETHDSASKIQRHSKYGFFYLVFNYTYFCQTAKQQIVSSSSQEPYCRNKAIIRCLIFQACRGGLVLRACPEKSHPPQPNFMRFINHSTSQWNVYTLHFKPAIRSLFETSQIFNLLAHFCSVDRHKITQ